MRKIALVSALCVALLVPTVALAGKIRHSGGLVGVETENKVTLRLTKKKGRIKKVSAFKAMGVPTNCDSGKFLFEFRALDPTKVNKKGTFRERLDNADGSVLRISGKVKGKGKTVVGNLKTTPFDGGSAGTCEVPKVRFKTKK